MSSLRWTASTIRSTSMCISDSRVPPSAVAPPTSSSRCPCASRRTVTIGCAMKCSVSPFRCTSICSESTRNGMSSLTICTTVCGECQPCSSTIGLKTRTFGSPVLRTCANCHSDRTAPNRSSTSRSATSSASRPSRYGCAKRSKPSCWSAGTRCCSIASTCWMRSAATDSRVAAIFVVPLAARLEPRVAHVCRDVIASGDGIATGAGES